ncbi:MAG: hypothetical protein ACI9XP_000805 [Lentimonas sp.]|jgi:hypothetical protein
MYYYTHAKITLLFFTLISTSLFSQGISFERVLAPAPNKDAVIDALSYSSSEYSDVDGDGDLDLFVIGKNLIGFDETILFLNDGDGNFSKSLDNNFVAVASGDVDFADIDGDGDEDLLVLGYNASSNNSMLYFNDGNGIFALNPGAGLPSIESGQSAFGDLDGDGDLDLIINGYTKSNSTDITKLYLNNGSGNFSLVVGATFTGVTYSTTNLFDCDGDNDLDLLITGLSQSGKISELYLNNGSASFSLVTGTTFPTLWYGSVQTFDADGDQDLDVFIAGNDENSTSVAHLYINNGSGVFSQQSPNPFIGMQVGDISIGDINGDTKPDIFYTGFAENGAELAQVFTNDGFGVFTLANHPELDGVHFSHNSLFDVDGDADLDLIYSGLNLQGTNSTVYALNDGAGLFTVLKESPFLGLQSGNSSIVDLNGDGNKELIISGIDEFLTHQHQALSYQNNEFQPFPSFNFPGYEYLYFEFADVDGNSSPDVFLSGRNASSQYVTELYTNDGSGSFTLKPNTFVSGNNGDINTVDVNNDGFIDLFVTGSTNAKLYLNDGIGNYVAFGSSISGVKNSAAKFGDLDGDNDLDLILTGRNSSNQNISKMYLNDGLGNFTIAPGTPFVAVYYSSILLVDIDEDNDLDVVISGVNQSNIETTNIYLNAGNGTFTLSPNNFLSAYYLGDMIAKDFDSDGDLDLILCGYASNNIFTEIYQNDGLGIYTLLQNTALHDIAYGKICAEDFNNDGKTDLLMVGSGAVRMSFLYKNTYACSPSSGLDEVIACVEHTWIDGITYTESNNTATHVLQNQDGCDSTVTLNLTINSVDITVDAQDPILTANSNTGDYQWVDCNDNYAEIPGAISQSFTPSANGLYAVIIEGNTCSDTSDCYIIQKIGISENEDLVNILAYPNPTSGLLTLNNEKMKALNLIVHDLHGRQLMHLIDVRSNEIQIDLSNLSNGIYLLEISNENSKVFHRIQKQ